jgi:hypothetical protein
MMYEEQNITVQCKHLARVNVGRRRSWSGGRGLGGGGGFSFISHEHRKELGVIKLSIAAKGRALRILSHKSNRRGPLDLD